MASHEGSRVVRCGFGRPVREATDRTLANGRIVLTDENSVGKPKACGQIPRTMSSPVSDSTAASIELAHYYVGGDGGRALSALLEGYEQRRSGGGLTETSYDNMRLRVKSRILQGTPPDAWIGWPGGELRSYVDAGTVMETTDVWEGAGIEDAYRSVAADAARIGDRYYGLPHALHRINDLYVNRAAAEESGIDPGTARDPRELAEAIESAAGDSDGPTFLLPLGDPFAALQLWEVTLLGCSDHRTFQAITAGRAAQHEDVIREALELVETFAAHGTEDALYHDLTDANESFVAGEAPVYPMGDWSAGVFVDREDFAYDEEWTRVPFPGTEDFYAVVMDAVIPSAESDGDALRPFLEYVASPDGQQRFNANKGSLPVRRDVSLDSGSAFTRDQQRALEESREQPQSITHGLSVSPGQLIDLKGIVAEFVDEWDADWASEAMVEVLDRN